MLCRLCITYIEKDKYKRLYNDEGTETEIYTIVSKYFEKQLLDFVNNAANEENCCQVICSKCWGYIEEFNEFQKSVTVAHEKYLELQPYPILKLELECDNTFTSCEEIPNKLTTTDTVDYTIEEIEKSLDLKPDPILLDDEEILPLTEISHNDCAEPDPVDITIKTDKAADDTIDAGKIKKTKLKSSKLKCKRKRSKPIRTKIPKLRICKISNKIDEPKLRISKISKKIDEPQVSAKKDTETPESIQTYREMINESGAILLERWPDGLPCPRCNETFPDFAKLRPHFREKHADSKPYMVCCDQRYFHRFRLIDHLRLHKNPESFKCPHCPKCSVSKRSLTSHIRNMHPVKENKERPYECNICHKRFTKAVILKGHMDLHVDTDEKFPCDECDKVFKVENRLNIHKKTVHGTVTVCELCGKSFRAIYSFRLHMLQHEGIDVPKFPCDICNAVLKTNYSLKRHKRMTHNDKTTRYVCSTCGKVSLSQDAMKSHKRYVHESVAKFKCTICEKAFKREKVLKEHLSTHTGEDLYKCPHCPRTFKTNGNMHHHRKRIHRKEWTEARQKRPFRQLPCKESLVPILKEVIV